jgi:starch-binding outer membrane protein, SusD/RagB family
MNMKNKSIRYVCAIFLFLVAASCDQSILDLKNPNSPVISDFTQEGPFLSWAQGAVYLNGFNGISSGAFSLADAKYSSSFLGDSFFFNAMQYHDLMGDVVGASAANLIINQIGVPDKVIYSDGTSSINTAPIRSVLRQNNARTKAGLNPFYYEWTYMYLMNNACNGLIANVEKVKFIGDGPSKVAAIKAWAYWWKGIAYSRIGSLYYAGLINNEFNTLDGTVPLNGNYLTKEQMIAEANKYLDLAASTLSQVTSNNDYEAVIATLIPGFCQVGKGGVLTTAEWKRSINTMKARNLLMNKRLKDMSSTDWNSILTLVNNGILATDLVFTGRSANTNFFFSASNGSVASNAVSTTRTFWPTERLIQEFDQLTDKRWMNNFDIRVNDNGDPAPKVDNGGTIIYGTRYYMINGGNGMPGVITYGSRSSGAYELYISGSYEENELMKAEALIHTAKVAEGLQSVDNVRSYQGAGLPAVSGLVTDPIMAAEILRKERRVALIFRGLAFYDARRLGYLDDVSKGGGRKGAVVLRSATLVDTNATINYNFLDYWDVPDDEIALNPNKTSTVTVNPN